MTCGSPIPHQPSLRQRVSWRLRDFRRRWSLPVWNELLDFILKHHPDARDSNIVSYADEELRIAGWYDADAAYGDLVPKAVLRQARLFSIEGHSGMSAGLVNHLSSKVVMFKPLTPLTGEPAEWSEVDEGVFQNRRMSSVFKGADGKAYWISGRVFRDPSGATYTRWDSRVPVEFPWMPGDPEIVEVTQ